MEKKQKEAEDHKKRMSALKAKKAAGAKAKSGLPVRKGFDKSKLGSGFMAAAKTKKDEVNGWAFDFDNESQNVAVSTIAPGN